MERNISMLTPELAEKIITEVRKYLDEDIIMVNTDGIIIASTDRGRIGQFHEGAQIASMQREKLIITEEKQSRLQGVKPGINLPVFFQQEVIGVIGLTGNPDDVSPFGEIIRKMTELLISESHFAEQSDWQLRALEGFLFDWLQKKEWDAAFFERAKILNISLDVPRQMVIVEFNQHHEYVGREIWSHLFSWPRKQEQDVMLRWGNDRIVLLLDASDTTGADMRSKVHQFFQFLEAGLGTALSAGVGKAVAPSHLIDSYRQAERALNVATPGENLIFDEDLTLEMILDDLSPQTKTEFVAKTIGPLLAEKELTQTIKELFNQNNSLKNTAEALHIHINTLHYRLKKVKDITGLSTTNLQQLLVLYLALIIAEDLA
jgi:carbohydrate diacid regulator